MISKAIDYVSKFISVALGFSIPISTALNSILLTLTVPLWFFGRDFKNKLSIVKDNKYIWAVLTFVGVYFVGLFYGESNIKEAIIEFAGVASLLLIPIMIPFFRDKIVRDNAVNVFLFAMTITLFLSCLIWFNLLPTNQFIQGKPNDATVFMLHITQNLLMAFCAFLFAVNARFATNSKTKILFIALTALAIINVTVMVGGKTGYVVLIVLTIYYFLAWLKWKGIFWAALVIAVFGLLTYINPSSTMHKSIDEFFIDSSDENLLDWHSKETKVTSTGYRLMFYKNTMKIICEHPILGVGTGGYPKAYSKAVKDTKMPSTVNPHNEYLMVTAQLGLLGLCAFLYLFYMQWRLAENLHSKLYKIIARGLVLTILAASMVTSTLMDHTERTFYIWMSALLFGGYISRRQEGNNEIICNNNNEK